jgi:hypothetical protein
MFEGIDSYYNPSSPGGPRQWAVTLHATGDTAVSALLSSDIDTASTDTVNLSSDVSGLTGGTAATQFTASLTKILQAATSVDPATGLREINAGVGQALGSQLGQLLTQSGFSQADAEAASNSLVSQLASPTQSSNGIAISLAGSAKTAGSYVGALSGGVEVSTWSTQSTTALSISFDPSSGNLTVKLDDHQLSAASIGWGSAAPGSVSIALTPEELPAWGTESGTTTSSIGSPIQETLTTTDGPPPSFTDLAQSDVDSPTSGTGTNNQALVNLDALQSIQATLPGIIAANAASSSNLSASGGTATPDSIGIAPVSPPKTASNTAAQQALTTLQAVLKKLQASNTASSVSLNASTTIGTLISNSNGTKSLTYTRPSGDAGIVNLPGVNVNA